MDENNNFLAFDLGASSGRAILGVLDKEKLELKEIHRFNNEMTYIHGSFYWNIFNLFNELKTGLRKCILQSDLQPLSIGIDTWGVDYALLNADGRITGLPFAYRDHRTDNAMEKFFRIMPREETYRLSGIQFMQINTLFQLFASVQQKDPSLTIAKELLFMPDALNYLFTGISLNEYTIASTSQLLKPGKPEWEPKLFEAAGISENLKGKIIQPGEIIGRVLPEIKNDTGCGDIICSSVASHDTASAIVSVPAEGKNWAYLSSGTWSLLGIENQVPLVSGKSMKMNFTNEGGVEGTTRFLKNIMGMWLIQECKRIWDKEGILNWQDIVDLCKHQEPFKCIIDPDDVSFLNPVNMPEAIVNYCNKTGQPVPSGKGEIARCIYESLVLKYKYTIGQIEAVTGKKIEKLHIIGGGAMNDMLNQWTADATGIPVIAGPAEATAIGNIMMQAKAMGIVNSIGQIRKIIRHSFDVKTFVPGQGQDWGKAFKYFESLVEGN